MAVGPSSSSSRRITVSHIFSPADLDSDPGSAKSQRQHVGVCRRGRARLHPPSPAGSPLRFRQWSQRVLLPVGHHVSAHRPQSHVRRPGSRPYAASPNHWPALGSSEANGGLAHYQHGASNQTRCEGTRLTSHNPRRRPTIARILGRRLDAFGEAGAHEPQTHQAAVQASQSPSRTAPRASTP